MEWLVISVDASVTSEATQWAAVAEQIARLDPRYRVLVVWSVSEQLPELSEATLDAAARGQYEEEMGALKRHVDELLGALELSPPVYWHAAAASLDRLALGVSFVEGHTPRIRARFHGELAVAISRMGAAYLAAHGVDCGWVDARELLCAHAMPDSSEAQQYLEAHCDHEVAGLVRARLEEQPERVLVVPGSIARHPGGETACLGRRASLVSAAYLAGKIEATQCELWSDQLGLYTASPFLVPSARLLRELSYEEAQEIATMGAERLKPKSLRLLQHHGIPLSMHSVREPAIRGLKVSKHGAASSPQVKAICSKSDVILVSMDTLGMWRQVGFLADVFACFKRHGLSVDLLSTSEANVSVSLDPSANDLDNDEFEAFLGDLRTHCRVQTITGCSAISLIGRDIRAVLHRLGPVLEVFEAQRVHMVSQAANDLNLTFVVDGEQAPRLVRELHALLFDAVDPDGEVFAPAYHVQAFQGRRAPAPWWKQRAESLLEMAAEGTPKYVYHAKTLRKSAEELKRLSSIGNVLYAIKANDNADVLRIFEGFGLGFECVSAGELDLLSTLFPALDPTRVLFTPNFAPREEYEQAFASGIRVTLDNLFPLEAWPEVFRGREVFVRVDPGEGHGHHAHVKTAGAASKFGVAPPEFDRLRSLLRAVDCRVVGLHAHAGSGIRNPDNWGNLAAFMADVARRFGDVRVLDLGGGLGVPERPGQESLDLVRLDEVLSKFSEAWPDFELWLEPGRFLVAEAGALLAKVTQVKQKGSVRYVGIDTGMNSLIRPALYGAYHEIVNLTRLDEPPSETVNVVGPICETGDTLGYSRQLPHTQAGDVLLIATAGAYGRVMSSHYNLRPPAEEHLLE